MRIRIILEFEGDSITIPINPENIEINTPGNNEKENVVGLGEIAILREPGLSTFTIESFIPDDEDPEEFLEFIQNWRAKKRFADFTVTGLDIDMLVGVDDFTYDRRSGEEERLYYTLSLTEYRPYGAKVMAIAQTQTEEAAVTPAVEEERVDNSPAVPQTYTVVTGDNLWRIAARFGGASGTNWKDLYDLNKSVIGNNPNLIYAGQIYALPEGWQS